MYDGDHDACRSQEGHDRRQGGQVEVPGSVVEGVAGRDRTLAGSSALPLAALKTPGIKRLLVACAAFMTAFYGVYGYLGDHLHEGLGQAVSVNGLAALVYGFGFGGAALLDGVRQYTRRSSLASCRMVARSPRGSSSNRARRSSS